MAATLPQQLGATRDLVLRAGGLLLENLGAATLGDVAGYSEQELLNCKNFGRTSLKEIRKKLDDMELTLGMDLESIRGGKG